MTTATPPTETLPPDEEYIPVDNPEELEGEPAQEYPDVPEALDISDMFFEASTTVYSRIGTPIALKAHGAYVNDTLDGLAAMVETSVKQHGWGLTPATNPPPASQPAQIPAARPAAQAATPPARPAAQAPAPAAPGGAPAEPAAAPGMETTPVASVSVDYTKGGDFFLRCKGGRYTQHGIRAYKEVIPLSVWETLPNWKPKVEYAPPPEIAVIIHDGTKVVEFRGK
ncbi:MAG: hypothetical protein M0R06_06365 [Sphaerochaeta sp.]|jgi:hypothetical protein|nr:hypothetical protein [Sphaerochaeta sp.]